MIIVIRMLAPICPLENEDIRLRARRRQSKHAWLHFANVPLAGVLLWRRQSQPSEWKNTCPMKESSDTSFISRPKAMQAGPPEASPTGHLFLGHKLLGELRILMRLSSNTNISDDGGANGDKGPSSY
jgi:hypothetical protein